MQKMMPLKFLKMHGLGNDFVILDMRGRTEAEIGKQLTPRHIRHLANRRLGIGCDQLIVIRDATRPTADAGLLLYNPDGSDCGACGNGTRCVGEILLAETGRDQITLETASREMIVKRQDGELLAVDMGPPLLGWRDIPLASPRDTSAITDDFDIGQPLLVPAQAVCMGNPHLVFFVKDAEAIDIARIGPRLEHHPLFPERTNVEFVSVTAPGHLRLRVWERGTGITLACGTAACATAVAAIRAGLVNGRSLWVRMDGGSAQLVWAEDNRVWLTGPVATVFTGALPDGFWENSLTAARLDDSEAA